MLTKNLLRTKSRKGRVTPQFLKTDDVELRQLAQELIDTFRAATGNQQEQLVEQSAEIIESSGVDVIIGRGLEKLLLDRTEFLDVEQHALVELREKVFTATSEHLSTGRFVTFQEMCTHVAVEVGLTVDALQQSLYSDLPIYSTVSGFQEISAEALLHRYNVSLVQGLLLRCASLTVRIADGRLTSLRPLFKFLRFFQLLASVQKVGAKIGPNIGDQQFEIVIDGPLSMFYQTQKYGLQLASFFPAVLHLKQWELVAAVQQKIGGKTEELRLDASCGLRSHYKNFSDYVPREVDMFKSLFEQRETGWNIAYADDCLVLGGENFCFPDFWLSKDSRRVALEIFHPWHERALLERLRQMENSQSETPLVIGVAKKLMAKADLSAAVTASKAFASKGFIFREMPTPDMVLERLKT